MSRHKYTPEQQILIFWSKVAITANDDLCWEWQAGKYHDGYGAMRVGKERYANRIAWSYPNYVIPEGMEICHSCDNPSCCNPKHLFLGTRLENMADMKAKGRNLESNKINKQLNRRKITKEEEIAIVTRYRAGGISHKQLAKEYRIALNHVKRLIRPFKYLYFPVLTKNDL